MVLHCHRFFWRFRHLWITTKLKTNPPIELSMPTFPLKSFSKAENVCRELFNCTEIFAGKFFDFVHFNLFTSRKLPFSVYWPCWHKTTGIWRNFESNRGKRNTGLFLQWRVKRFFYSRHWDLFFFAILYLWRKLTSSRLSDDGLQNT